MIETSYNCKQPSVEKAFPAGRMGVGAVQLAFPLVSRIKGCKHVFKMVSEWSIHLKFRTQTLS